MPRDLTTIRNVAATRAEVAAAVDRHLPEWDGAGRRIETWRSADWTSSLQSWRRTGRWQRPRQVVTVTIDLLELGAGLTQLTICVRNPSWLRGPGPVELVHLVATIRHAAEGGSPGARCLGAPAGRVVTGTPAPAAPVVGYSAP